VNPDDFYSRLKEVRVHIKNDRALLRAHHYFNETVRAKKLNDAIRRGDIIKVISLMKESGDSSYKYLQNVYDSHDTKRQAVSLGLALAEKCVQTDGLTRVQGGGFAGTIQAVVKKELVGKFMQDLSAIFGSDAIIPVEIRLSGTKLIL
jgi:galactokinase